MPTFAKTRAASMVRTFDEIAAPHCVFFSKYRPPAEHPASKAHVRVHARGDVIWTAPGAIDATTVRLRWFTRRKRGGPVNWYAEAPTTNIITIIFGMTNLKSWSSNWCSGTNFFSTGTHLCFAVLRR